MSNIKELTDDDLEGAVQNSELPVLIDFSATWCQPCKALAPTIDAVAKEYKGKINVFKVDIDQAANAVTQFGISGVPTCIFFKTGKEVDRFMGNLDLRSIKEKVEKVVSA